MRILIGLTALVLVTTLAGSKSPRQGEPPVCKDAGVDFPVSIGRPVLHANVTPTPQQYYVDVWIPAVSIRQGITNVSVNAYLFDRRMRLASSNGHTFPAPKFEPIMTSVDAPSAYPLYATTFDVEPDNKGVGLYRFYPKMKITIAVPGYGEQCFWTQFTRKER